MKHFSSLLDITSDDLTSIFDTSGDLKSRQQRGERPPLLAGRMLALLFEKPSLRTRVSFEAAMTHLGGTATFLTSKEAGLGGREALCDVARVLSRFADAVALRTFSQQLIEDFRGYAACPVINALSDELHPCQALTDLFTMREAFGELSGRKLVYIGDGNNVARSLAIGTAMVGMSMVIAAPPGFELASGFLAKVKRRLPAANITQTTDPAAAVQGADVVYTDVWASMGQEAEADRRRQIFAPYQVNAALMAHAPGECRFMHDMPARRGEEVTDDVLDGPNSIAFEQAENRMHVAKGLLVWLLDAANG